MALGFALFAGTRPDVIGATAREAEALGYTSFWVNHPGPVDGLAALAHGAGQTRRTALGVGVIRLHTRGPESIAEGVKGTALPVDRLLLGVGSPNPSALARVRAGVAALRSALSARIVVAALGPQMCRLAGEVADGVLFNWLTPAHARQSAECVRAGAGAGPRAAAAGALRVRAVRRRAGGGRRGGGGGRPLHGHPRLRRPLRAHGGVAAGDGDRGRDAGGDPPGPRPLGRRDRRGRAAGG